MARLDGVGGGLFGRGSEAGLGEALPAENNDLVDGCDRGVEDAMLWRLELNKLKGEKCERRLKPEELGELTDWVEEEAESGARSQTMN